MTGGDVSAIYQIRTVVGDAGNQVSFYTRNSPEDDVTLTVSKPVPGLVTGGGYLKAERSNGLNPAEIGTKINFGFNIQNATKKLAPKGNINVIFRKMITEEDGSRKLHVFQIKGNAMTSLTSTPYKSGTVPGTAIFNGKANIQDITDPLNPISIAGNQTLQVTMTDRGEPGKSDKIGITLFNAAGGVYFSSNWDGTTTMEQLINGGNLAVR